MKKSRVWQAIVPGTQTKPQDTLRIRKTPWHAVTKQPPAVPLQTPLLNGMKKSRFWQEFHCWGTELHCSRHRNLYTEHQNQGCWQAIPLDTLQIRKTPWHGVTKQPSLCRGQTSLLNRMKNQGSGRQLFQALKTSHKTPFKSGKHPGTA